MARQWARMENRSKDEWTGIGRGNANCFLVSIEKLRDEPAPVIEVTENTFRFLLPMYAPDGGEIKHKTIFIEPLLVVASSLLWIFVLPLARGDSFRPYYSGPSRGIEASRNQLCLFRLNRVAFHPAPFRLTIRGEIRPDWRALISKAAITRGGLTRWLDAQLSGQHRRPTSH